MSTLARPLSSQPPRDVKPRNTVSADGDPIDLIRLMVGVPAGALLAPAVAGDNIHVDHGPLGSVAFRFV